MNAVDAIDAWIDEWIDDLSDAELELVLELLDAVSASAFSDLETSELDNEDLDDLVGSIDAPDDELDFIEEVLRSAIYGEPWQAGRVAEAETTAAPRVDTEAETVSDIDPDDDATPGESDRDDDDRAEGDDEPDDDDDRAEAEAEPDESDLDDDDDRAEAEAEPDESDLGNDDRAEDLAAAGRFEPTGTDDEAAEDTLDDEREDARTDDGEPGQEVAEAGDEEAEHRAAETATNADRDVADELFWSDLASVTAPEGDLELLDDESQPVADPGVDTDPQHPGTTALLSLGDVSPVPLLPGDDLGPSFLTAVAADGVPDAPPDRWRRYGFALLFVAALAAFIFGMIRLLDSLDAEEVADTDEVTTEAEDADTSEAGTTEDDQGDEDTTRASAEAPDPAPSTADAAAAPPEPTPEPEPPARIALRLVNGNVVVATFTLDAERPTFDMVYDASDDETGPAANVAWINGRLGVVDSDGNVSIVDPDDRRPRTEVIYAAGGGLDAAVEIAPLVDRAAIRTSAGDIAIIDTNGLVDPDSIEFLWLADEGGAAATDLTSIGDLLPFTLDDGFVKMVDANDSNALLDIWSAETQPPAFNLDADSRGILIGVGQGAVARYFIEEVEGPPVIPVWDPFSTDETPAIGYSQAGSRTAVVLADGAIVLADETLTGEKVWDPAETELRALSVSGSDEDVVVLLETGSVVRIPLDADLFIESIWDVTDETLSPANQAEPEPDSG